jgi:hypothetical protein
MRLRHRRDLCGTNDPPRIALKKARQRKGLRTKSAGADTAWTLCDSARQEIAALCTPIATTRLTRDVRLRRARCARRQARDGNPHRSAIGPEPL